MINMMTRYLNTARARTATIFVAALTLVLAAALPVQAAGMPNCNDEGATTPCFSSSITATNNAEWRST